jgi:hypothetical protein
MAGVVPVMPPPVGLTNGKLEVETERFITFEEMVNFFPSSKAFFDELDQLNRRYYYIDGHGRVVLEIDIEGADYKWKSEEHPRGGMVYNLSVDFGRRLPAIDLKRIVSLDRFIVNICSKNYPRAVTVDLLNNEVVYVHESLWIQKGEENRDESKDVLQILQWLIEKKQFKLVTEGGLKQYRNLMSLLGGQ